MTISGIANRNTKAFKKNAAKMMTSALKTPRLDSREASIMLASPVRDASCMQERKDSE